MEEQEKAARDLYRSLDDLMEYNRLMKLCTFPGKDYKSVVKMNDFLENLWKAAIAGIETNEWYKTEKAEMKKLKMSEIMVEGSTGEYDPNYEVKMDDVFRVVVKK